MKIFETLPIFLLISFGSSIPTTSMRCLSGPNLGPGLEEETPGHLIDCSGPNQVCLRVDAALYSASQTNNEGKQEFKSEWERTFQILKAFFETFTATKSFCKAKMYTSTCSIITIKTRRIVC